MKLLNYFCLCYFFVINIFLIIRAEDNVFKKCKCAPGEIESYDTCAENNLTKIIVWNYETNNQEVLDVKNLNNTVIQPLKCPFGNMTKVISYEIGFFTKNASLIVPLESPTDHYCFENTFDHFGNPIHRIEVCLLPASVPLCCKKNEFFVPTEGCMALGEEEASNVDLFWPEKFTYFQKPVQCPGVLFPSVSVARVPPTVLEFSRMLSNFQNGGDFCLTIQNLTTMTYFIKSCDTSCVGNSCVPSCCLSSEEVYDFESHSCTPYNFHKNESTIYDIIDGIEPNYSRLPDKMNCEHSGILYFDNNTQNTFLPNSSLFVKTRAGSSVFLGPEEYCLGKILFSNGSVVPSGMVCLKDIKEEHCLWRWTVVRVCLIISSIFIIATLVVYVGVASLRQRIQGACLISELIALLVSQINLVILQTNQQNFSPGGCLAAGVIEVVFVLASFFWLNVMCFDVWSKFRKMRAYNEKLMSKKLFTKYSLYAWGIPSIVGIIVVIVEKLEAPLRPKFIVDYKESCFFNQNDLVSQWLYMYGIILILLLINSGFFMHLAFNVFMTMNKERKRLFTQSATTSTSNTHADTDNIKLHAKLFIIMGIPWIIEVISTAAGEGDQCYIWIFDLVNLLRGLLIFIIFICKKTTKEKIISAWFPAAESQKPTTSSSSRKTSVISLSTWLPSRKISKTSLGSGGTPASNPPAGRAGPSNRKCVESTLVEEPEGESVEKVQDEAL